jgi:hypothetical protein
LPPPGYGAPAFSTPGGGFQPSQGGSGSGSNGMAIAALITGILGLVTFWLCGFGGLLGIVAVVLGVLGLQKAKKEPGEPQKGLAIGGIVTGALAIVLGAGIFIAVVAFGDDANDDFQRQLNEGGNNTDPSDGTCDESRFIQDPDC